MAYGQRSQRYATSQILRHQFCFELRTVTPAPANLLGIVLCHYKHPLIISWVLSLAYFDGAEKMPSPEAYRNARCRYFSGLPCQSIIRSKTRVTCSERNEQKAFAYVANVL